MAAYLEDLRVALTDVIQATWPEVEAGGIYRSRQLGRIPWAQKTPPVCVLDLDPAPTGEWGLTNRTDLVTVTIYYIVRDSPDDADALALVEKLEALRDALWPFYDATSGGQTVAYPRVTDSLGLPANQYFLAQQKSYWAGAVIAQVVAGVTA